MVLTAVAGASIVVIAFSHALGAPFDTGEVRQCESVLGHVGLLPVTTDAAICQSVGITGIDEGCSRLCLIADNRAGRQLTLAPRVTSGVADTVWVDDVVGINTSNYGSGCHEESVLDGRHFGG